MLTRAIAIAHRFMNLVWMKIGGVPMCHCAEGVVRHIGFDSRTRWASVIFGMIWLSTGLFLPESIATLSKLCSPALLGVILMFRGLELPAGVWPHAVDKADHYARLFTAGVSIRNMGAAHLRGLALWRGFHCGG